MFHYSDIVCCKRKTGLIIKPFTVLTIGGYFMSKKFGPRDRNNELTENEELELLEAYQSADEYLNMDNDVDDFYFESEE